MLWVEVAMFLVEFLVAVCAVAVCGPCFLACARRLVIGDEVVGRGPATAVREADTLGCDEPACPYYKQNIRYLMLPGAAGPARRRAQPLHDRR